MDEYLNCLMEYISSQRVGAQLKQSPQQKIDAEQADHAYDELLSGLTPPQKETLERFANARDAMTIREMELLFREGVLLGKWMAAV